MIFNAATSSVLDKSKYFVRTSYTLPQITVPIARFVLDEGVKSVVTMVSDYAPGADAETSFVKTFEAGGGKVIEKVRVPLKTTDFGPFLQRVKGSAPQALFIFFPGGPPSYGVIKAYKDNDLRSAGIRLFGTSEADEKDLPAIGDAALGSNPACSMPARMIQRRIRFSSLRSRMWRPPLSPMPPRLRVSTGWRRSTT